MAKTKYKRKELQLDQLEHLVKIKRNPRDHFFLTVNRDEQLSGGYSTYIQLKSVGVKVTHYGYKTKRKLLSSSEWRKAQRELETLVRANSLIKTAAPKGYRVFPLLVKYVDYKWDSVKHERNAFDVYEWRPAIAMEHINGTRLGESSADSYSVMEKAKQLLRDAKIDHGDLHSYNVLIRNKKVRNKSDFIVIDWDAKFVKF